MKKSIIAWIILAAMTLSLAACGAPAAGNAAPAAETQDQAPAADDGQIIVEETPETEAREGRQASRRSSSWRAWRRPCGTSTSGVRIWASG